MGTRESYEPGVFSWVDLSTSDTDAAKAFYAELFGWEYDDRETDGGPTYSMALKDDQVTAAITSAGDGPPRWTSYITVESADDATEKAKEAGAEVVAGPFDVMDAGRMAVLQDPSGAVVAVWEPKETKGASVVNVPGALTWNDLMTHDVEKAVEFYREVFEWDIGSVEDAPDERHAIKVGDGINGGIAKLPEAMGENAVPHWLAVFATDDAEATSSAAEEHGGKALSPVIDVPSGRFAVLMDPQGAVFGVVDGEFDD